MNYFQLLTDLVTLTGFAPLPLNHFVLKRTLNHIAKLAWLGPRSSKSKVLDSKWTHSSSDNFINKISLPKWNKFLYKKRKACVLYFHQIFIFWPHDSPSKTMKNAFYFIFFVLEISKFLYYCPSPFFCLSAIALEDDRR